MVSLSLAGEVTFEEARAHLGLNQRQWSPQAIVRTTRRCCRDRRCPSAAKQHPFELPKAAWYRNYRRLPMPSASKQLWQMQTFQMSSADVHG